MKKRVLTILLTISLVLMIPAAAFAEAESAQAAENTAAESTMPAVGANEHANQSETPAVETGWNADRTQYRDENGNLVTGLFNAKTSDGAEALFYADDNGTVMTKAGFITVNGVRRYVTTKGCVKNSAGFIKFGGKKYRINDKGVVRTKKGAFTVKGIRYVIPSDSEDGALYTKRGIAKANGYLYFVKNSKGQLGKNLTYKIGSKSYHVNKSGVVKTGKHKWKDGKYYYSTKQGNLRTAAGLITLNSGKRILVKKGGLVAVSKKSKYSGNYYISNKYGIIMTGLFSWKSTLYYASDKGVLKKKAGIIQNEGNDYYIKAGGVVAVSKLSTYDGKLYASDSKGHLRSGLFKNDDTYYYAGSDHVINTTPEIFKYKGSYYYNKKGGGLARNEWVTIGDKHYYAGDKAAFRTSEFTSCGVTFKPSDTGVISDKEYKKLFPDPAEDEAGDWDEDVD